MERLFNLDPQLIHDAVLLALAVFVMFTFLSYLLFNPARDFLKKRQDKIKNDLDTAAADKADARKLKEDYNARISMQRQKKFWHRQDRKLWITKRRSLPKQKKKMQEFFQEQMPRLNWSVKLLQMI